MSLPFYLKEPGPIWYDRVPWIAADFETTNLDNGSPWNDNNELVLACTAGDSGIAREASPQNPLSHGKVVLAAHNAKFELGWLYRLGYDLRNILPWDTMIAEYVLAGNRKWSLDLGSVARRYGLPTKDPFIDALMKGGVCPSEMPRNLLLERCLRDTEVTYAIARAQYGLLKEAGLLPVFFTRCITTPALSIVESEGMTLDPGRVEEELREQHAKKVLLEARLSLVSGGANLASSKQLGEIIYGKLGFKELTRRDGTPMRTGSGKPRTDKAALASLKATTKAQREFLELRAEFGKVNARITKALTFFKEVCDARGGTFFGQFNQTVTQTHRLSASGRSIVCSDGKKRGVQFQNLPREYKRMFRSPRPGWKMMEIDGSQLEFRVAAELGRDAQAERDIVQGADIHRYTASVLLGKPEEDVSSEERTWAKAETFGPLFGREFGTRAQVAYVEAFRTKYSGIFKTQQGWVSEVLRTKHLRTASGLIFHWPDCRALGEGKVSHKTNIFNYPIQSFATADIIPISLVYTFWSLDRKWARVVNTVHDSVVIEVREDMLDKVRENAVVCWLDQTYGYLDAVYGHKMHVPLGIGVKVGDYWGEGAEHKWSEPYGG